VAAYWGFWPSPVIARQPIGHQTIATSPNGYIYRPVYADDATAASIALPNATDVSGVAPPIARQPAGPASAEALFQTALVLFKAGRYEAAIDRLNRVVNQKPDHGDAYLLMVQANFGLANYEAAVEALSAALATAPEYNWEKFARGYSRYFASSLRFAVHLRSLERFVELHSERVEGHLLLGYQYGSLGKTDRALAELARTHPNAEGEKLARHFAEAGEAPTPGPDVEPEPGPRAAPNPPPVQRRGRAF
jgi:tetratricopeptide (TPR) repeat protein